VSKLTSVKSSDTIFQKTRQNQVPNKARVQRWGLCPDGQHGKGDVMRIEISFTYPSCAMILLNDPTRPTDLEPVSSCMRVLTTSKGYMSRISVTPAIAPAVKLAQNGRAIFETSWEHQSDDITRTLRSDPGQKCSTIPVDMV
jgi:hypothetical protein